MTAAGAGRARDPDTKRGIRFPRPRAVLGSST